MNLKRITEAVKNWVAGGQVPLREAAGMTIDDDDAQWRRLSESGRDLSPFDQTRQREAAIYLWDTNLLANRIVELQLAYLLADGVSVSAADGQTDAERTLQRHWADPINAWDEKLPERMRHLALCGEQCWPVFVNEIDGHVRIGFLDPANIANVVVDPDNPTQPIGIITTKNRKGEYRKYRVIINGGEDVFTERTRAIRDTFSDGECFYFRVNALSGSVRGRSDLRAQADWVDAYDQFLFNELDRYNVLRRFFFDVTLTGATPEVVKKKASEIKAPRVGEVRVHNETETWDVKTPDLDAADTSQGARMFRNQVLGGATTPEHWFGGGGDVNRSTGESMAEPTRKVYTMRQREIINIITTVCRYQLRMRYLAVKGIEPEWDAPETTVRVVFSEMTSQDTTRYAAALQQVVTACIQAINAALMTDETAVALIAAVAGQIGVEFDAKIELMKAKTATALAAEADTFVGAVETGA